MQKLPETEQKRNCLCIRWNDEDMKRVSDEAYSKRQSCSELVRGIVLERLQLNKQAQPLGDVPANIEKKAGAQPAT